MNIDFFIENKSLNNLIGKGSSKNCYAFNENTSVVLIETRYLLKQKLEEELENIIYIKNILDKIDVNSFKILDYKIFSGKIYILETKVKGEPLQKIKSVVDVMFNRNCNVNYIDNYIDHLSKLNNSKILKKFVQDYFKIINNGLSIDPARPDNFLFDEEYGVGFVDIGKLYRTYDKELICYYIIRNIIYFDVDEIDSISMDQVIKVSDNIIDIYYKLVNVYKELGYSGDFYSLSVNGSIYDYINKRIGLLIDKIKNEIGLEEHNISI